MCSLIQYPTSLSLYSSVRSVLFIYVRQGDCDKGHARALFIWSTEDGRTCPSGSVSTSTSPLLSFRTVASASVPQQLFRRKWGVPRSLTPHCVLWHLLMSRLCSVFQDILNVLLALCMHYDLMWVFFLLVHNITGSHIKWFRLWSSR